MRRVARHDQISSQITLNQRCCKFCPARSAAGLGSALAKTLSFLEHMKFAAARNPAGHPRQKTAFFPEDFCKIQPPSQNPIQALD
jgi:hypothetical protein